MRVPRGGTRRVATRVESSTGVGSRGRAALELVGVVFLLGLVTWVVDGSAVVPLRALSGALIAAIAVATHRRRRLVRRGSSATPLSLPEDLRGGPDAKAWGAALVATAAAAGAVLAATWLMGWWTGALRLEIAGLSSWGALRWWGAELAVIALQQLALQLLVFPLCRELLGGQRGRALVVTALVFGALHLPNLLLSALTSCAALLWCSLYLRRPRLLPLIASHLVLAVVARAACGDAIYNMRVGASVLPLLPRTVVAEDGQELRVTPRSLEGFVDGCRVGADRARCWGWSMDLDRQRVVESIAVLAEGGLHHYPLSASARPDVSDHFGLPQLEHCGFVLDLPASWFSPGAAVRFFGVAPGGQSAELEYGSDYDWRTPSR